MPMVPAGYLTSAVRVAITAGVRDVDTLPARTRGPGWVHDGQDRPAGQSIAGIDFDAAARRYARRMDTELGSHSKRSSCLNRFLIV